MKTDRIIGIILAASIFFTGCKADIKKNETVIDWSSDALGSAEETVTVTEETTTETEKILFEFNPHVYSGVLAQEIPQESWDSFYNLCDALRKGETTFECSSQEAYDFAMNVSTLASLFPAACLKVSGESNDGSVPYENGVGRIYYNMPVEEFVAREADFEALITVILNSALEYDDDDFEKCLKLYLYVAENYDYRYDEDDNNNESGFVYQTFMSKKGVCVDYGAVYGYLLLQVGIDALDIGCFEPDMCHAWTYVVLNGQGYHVDTTWALTSCYEGMDDVYLDYFLMSDEDRNQDGCLVRDLSMQALPQFFLSQSTIKLKADDEQYSFPDYSTFVSLDEENKILYYKDMYGNIGEMAYA
ncbi:MAG: transglutaminase domain-containing protein [Clostridiales bacterium]|nr:transglutaminase domain-containing protein [Clostridiales bacterium]